MKKFNIKSVLAMALVLATIMGILSGCKPAPVEQKENLVGWGATGTYTPSIADKALEVIVGAYAEYDKCYNDKIKSGPLPEEFHTHPYDPDYKGMAEYANHQFDRAVFLNPEDAWNDIRTQTYRNDNTNNWFRNGYDTEKYNDAFWTALNDYLSVFGEHKVDPSHDSKWYNGRDMMNRCSTADLAWAEYYTMHNEYTDVEAMADYQNMTLEEYMDYRTSMTEYEAKQFRIDWYPSIMGNYKYLKEGWTLTGGATMPWRDVAKKTFDTWYTEQGFTPTNHEATSIDPVVTPTPAPTVTPTPVPTETPAPTPTVAPEPETPVQHFPDVTPDKWYYEAVNNMAEAGILKGYSDGLFHPDELVTKGEVATIFCRISEDSARAFKADPKSADEWAKEQGHWSAKFIAYATEGPRAYTQMTMMYYTTIEHANEPEIRQRVFNAIGEYAYAEQFINKYCYRKFIDSTHYYIELLIDENAVENIFWDYFNGDKGGIGMSSNIANLVYLGIIHGDQNGNLNLKSNITRAEFCQVLYNMGATKDWLGDGN